MSKEQRRQLPRSAPQHWGGTPDPEDLDETPMELPLGWCRPAPLTELIGRMVQVAIEGERDDQVESFDEANDFEEVDPDALDMSPYELTELRPEQDGFEDGPEQPSAPLEFLNAIPPEDYAKYEGTPIGEALKQHGFLKLKERGFLSEPDSESRPEDSEQA